ncbi:VWA domain-containing protein, partial [candidate division KSB1 bacterium]|nr:VWA domain-containing protein [candidate division KSB1 bacterium]
MNKINKENKLRMFLYVLVSILMIPQVIPAQNPDLNADFRVNIDSVYIRDFSYRGKTAQFPFPIISRITVIDDSFQHVSGLADTVNWLGPNDIANINLPVSSIWKPVLEYHRENPVFPDDADVFNHPPGPFFTEVKNDTLFALSSVLVMDASFSMFDSKNIEHAVNAARQFVNLTNPNDRIAILAFDDSITVFQDFTTDKSLLLDAIQQVRNKRSPGKTALYDALTFALNKIEVESSLRQRNVIVYADGEDNASDMEIHNLNTVINQAKEFNIPVHSIALGENVIDPEKLQSLADSTGGYFYNVMLGQDLVPVYERLVELFHSYYLMAHASPDPIYNNSWRTVDVTVELDDFSGNGTGNYFVHGPPALSISLTSMTDQQQFFLGKNYNSAAPGEEYNYLLTVGNFDDVPSNQLRLVHKLPDWINLGFASENPVVANNDSLLWNFESLENETEVNISVQVQVSANVPADSKFLFSSVELTDVLNNRYTDADTVLLRQPSPPELSDVTVSQIARTDSFTVVSGDTFRHVKPDEEYFYRITVSNLTNVVADEVVLIDYLPEYVSYISSEIPAEETAADSIVWRIGQLQPQASLQFQLKAKTAAQLPQIRVPIYNTLIVSAANEDTGLLSNNTSADTLFTSPQPCIEIDPSITVTPATVESDAIVTVRVKPNVPVHSWDVWLYYA